MPTFVLPDVEYDEDHNDHYTAYNKPFAVAAWLRVSNPAYLCQNAQTPYLPDSQPQAACLSISQQRTDCQHLSAV